MNNNIQIELSKEYKSFILEIKNKIKSSQTNIAIVANSSLLFFYWELGEMISKKQMQTKWGSKFIEQMSVDLRKEFPNLKGFSRTNLFYIKKFYQFYSNDLVQRCVGLNKSIVQRSGGLISAYINNNQNLSIVFQIPWRHNIEILSKASSVNEALFYIQETISNNWSRDVLALQIKSNLYKRQGKAVTNFKNTLPPPQSDLAEQTIKDPYIFDFLTFTKPYKEKDIENQLIDHITKFLLELGKGFAFIGNQYHFEIAENDYYIDLLFYHVILKCFVVIELKNTKFIPEYAGKLNFYLSAVDSILKSDDDKPTIGILLCRDKNNIEAEFALRDINKPMGISEFQLTEIIPDNLKSSLPTIEEIENELKKLGTNDE